MKLLFLDDETVRHEWFALVHLSHEIWHAYNIEQFEKQLRRCDKFDVISFDHDLGTAADGNDCAELMLRLLSPENLPRECWVHSWNPVGAERIMRTLRSAGIAVVRRPFAAKEDK